MFIHEYIVHVCTHVLVKVQTYTHVHVHIVAEHSRNFKRYLCAKGQVFSGENTFCIALMEIKMYTTYPKTREFCVHLSHYVCALSTCTRNIE